MRTRCSIAVAASRAALARFDVEHHAADIGFMRDRLRKQLDDNFVRRFQQARRRFLDRLRRLRDDGFGDRHAIGGYGCLGFWLRQHSPSFSRRLPKYGKDGFPVAATSSLRLAGTRISAFCARDHSSR